MKHFYGAFMFFLCFLKLDSCGHFDSNIRTFPLSFSTEKKKTTTTATGLEQHEKNN